MGNVAIMDAKSKWTPTTRRTVHSLHVTFSQHAKPPPSEGRSLDDALTRSGTVYDFDRIPLRPDPKNESHQRPCPFSLESPRACPFGGACHTCPARV